MRKLVLLVGVVVVLALSGIASKTKAGIIPTLEDKTGRFGFYPISNEVSLYKNYDDTGNDRGKTLQIISINNFKFLTSFNFEFTADYNFDFTAGLDRDHYVEISIVKPVTSFISLNAQRIMSTFESKPVNQFGVRLVF